MMLAPLDHPRSGERLLDLRGLRCPWPALRVARALRDAGPGVLLVVADDPIADREIGVVAAARGWRAIATDTEFGLGLKLMPESPLSAGNPPFTPVAA